MTIRRVRWLKRIKRFRKFIVQWINSIWKRSLNQCIKGFYKFYLIKLSYLLNKKCLAPFRILYYTNFFIVVKYDRFILDRYNSFVFNFAGVPIESILSLRSNWKKKNAFLIKENYCTCTQVRDAEIPFEPNLNYTSMVHATFLENELRVHWNCFPAIQDNFVIFH